MTGWVGNTQCLDRSKTRDGQLTQPNFMPHLVNSIHLFPNMLQIHPLANPPPLPLLPQLPPPIVILLVPLVSLANTSARRLSTLPLANKHDRPGWTTTTSSTITLLGQRTSGPPWQRPITPGRVWLSKQAIPESSPCCPSYRTDTTPGALSLLRCDVLSNPSNRPTTSIFRTTSRKQGSSQVRMCPPSLTTRVQMAITSTRLIAQQLTYLSCARLPSRLP